MGSDDGSSDDGDAAHDRFVAWMSSHEIQGSLDSDNMSDYFPEQLPEWDESAVDTAGGAEAAEAGTGGRMPTPPATTDMSAAAAVETLLQQQLTLAGALEQQGEPSALKKLQATDLPAGLVSRGAGVTDAPGSSVLAEASAQQSLPPIKTTTATNSTAAAAGPGKASTAGQGGAGGFTAVPRVVLPGRAMMPAGINDTVVPIFDGEPTSIAAYLLSSRAYQQQLNAAMRLILHEESKRVAEEVSRLQQEAKRATAAAAASTAAALRQQIQQGSGNGADSAGSSTPPLPAPTQHSRTRSQDAGAAAALAAVATHELEGGSNNTGVQEPAIAGDGSSTAAAVGSANGSVAQQQGSPKHMHTNSTGSSSSTTAAWRVKLRQQQAAASRSPGSQKQVQPDWLALLLSPEPLHVKHAFEDESPGMPWLRARFGVTAYFAPQFAELRRRCIVGGEAAYITSLCRCRKWASRGGKSNAYFAKTRDDRFIIKSLSKPEKVR
jgi:hypothetical protein